MGRPVMGQKKPNVVNNIVDNNAFIVTEQQVEAIEVDKDKYKLLSKKEAAAKIGITMKQLKRLSQTGRLFTQHGLFRNKFQKHEIDRYIREIQPRK